jgi:hypothetical protein
MNRRFDRATPWAQPVQQPAAIPPGVEAETSTPARPAGFVSDVLVPLVQALITGALLAGVVVFAVARTDYDGDLLGLWGILALTISSVAWLVLLGQTRRLLWVLERVTGADLDGDGVKGKPQERVVIVNAARAQAEAAQQENADRASQFAQFVAALPTKGTAARVWEGELGRETYQQYRAALIRLGWAKWNSLDGDGQPNERKGWALTIPAEDILKRISG